MKNSKLIFLLLLLIVNSNLLTASEVTTKAQIKQVNFELNDNAKLLIDCSIKKNKLWYIFYKDIKNSNKKRYIFDLYAYKYR